MAIPQVTKENIMKAFKYIDEHGVPSENQSIKYDLVTEDGKHYPPKYVIAVADHLANRVEISVNNFNAVEAVDYLKNLEFKIENKQYELTITKEKIQSTDDRFTMDNLWFGDDYDPLGTYFKEADGTEIRRAYRPHENKISNQTMPRLAFQVFEEQIVALSDEDKKQFPICKYPNRDMIYGIYTDLDEYQRNQGKGWKYLEYKNNDKQFFIYSWNMFSTIIFVQECLKRWGEDGDQFVLRYYYTDRKTEEELEKEYAARHPVSPQPEPNPDDGKQKPNESYELTITKDSVTSTDSRFTEDDLNDGGKMQPYEILEVYLQRANGEKIYRKYQPKEWHNCNMTMPRIAFQVFEKEIDNLSDEEKKQFPIGKPSLKKDVMRGIYSNLEEYTKNCGTDFAYMTYNNKYFIYCWNMFSTITFVQECLKRWGRSEDQFVFFYRDYPKPTPEPEPEPTPPIEIKYQIPYSKTLLAAKNLIFHGAPGTGKTFLAKQIAADIISKGEHTDYEQLSDEEKKQIEFVQFHPSYDYADFVEGLRPTINDDGTMRFELHDGIFKKFVARARKNFEDSQKPAEMIVKELSVEEAMQEFFDNIEMGETFFQTKTGNKFTILNVTDTHVYVSIPGNGVTNKLTLRLEDIREMLESDKKFETLKEIAEFFKKPYIMQTYAYNLPIYKEILKYKKKTSQTKINPIELKKYIFIIDEINRGEISKIFGELFFAIDPGYRGRAGEVSTQYANMHANPNDKFYIPDNVYIIGTMNDIDRSVDSFDFAMRRRFRFVELTAEKRADDILKSLDEPLKQEVLKQMNALNEVIANVQDLNRNYQIGASYFLKRKKITAEELWTDHLQPLLESYVQGLADEDDLMKKFKKAYDSSKPAEENKNEITVEN